jgi:hypothetical protein
MAQRCVGNHGSIPDIERPGSGAIDGTKRMMFRAMESTSLARALHVLNRRQSVVHRRQCRMFAQNLVEDLKCQGRWEGYKYGGQYPGLGIITIVSPKINLYIFYRLTK